MKTETKNHWPDEIRLKMIEKSKFYPDEMPIYQYGYYDGFQKAQEAKTVIFKDGTFIKVDNGVTWEYENDANWLVTV